MATAAPARATPASRRSSSVTSTGPTTPSASIARGATARSAVSPRVTASMNSTAAARRGSLKGATPPASIVNGEARETRESLSASLKEETEKKEQLLVQLQDKDQTIATLTTDNDNVNSALKTAETRLAEMYAEQNRMEEEMAARIDIAEKLRTQVRDLEKDKRDIQRRYNEQATTFEAERQAFYDNEQHLKSRIQSLTSARKQPAPPLTSPSVASIAETETEEDANTEADTQEDPNASQADGQDINDPEQEPAEMTALKLELSTLSTSYSSLQQTLVLLQTQLQDLKRVNNELQEENESYNILLRERTLNGQFDILRMGGGTSVSESASETGDDDEAEGDSRDGESLRSRNTGRSVLDPVEELVESELDPAFKLDGEQDQEGSEEGERASNVRRHARKRSKSHSPQPRGESLANLPITGPGLDLAAELGRAENKDILEGRVPLENERVVPGGRNKKGRKASDTTRKVSMASEPGMEFGGVDDIDALRNEVKSLKDANKALSLYASKIIDRIISQEGFEHVLAVDYDSKAPMTPNTAATFTTFSKPPAGNAQPSKKGRPQSAIFSFSSSSPNPPQSPGLTTFNSPPTPNTASPPKPPASARASRRSLSFDWKSFSMFGGSDKKPEQNPNLRPLTLRAGSSPVVTGGRKLDTQEDEEDRKERERLNATMKLMGIEKPPAVQKSYSTSSDPTRPAAIDTSNLNSPATASTATPLPPTPSSRFSLFRRTPSMTTSDASSGRSSGQGSPYTNGGNTPNLTQEALEQAEAEGAIAALEAHERHLSAEIAKG
ncbi:hypothetical protein EVJ58_g4188, partial [Rhodofomes roseus]